MQVFNQESQLLITFGGHGLLPGQFQGLVSIAIDKNNRVFTSEIYPGRVQQFRYVTDAEAEQAKERQRRAAREEGWRRTERSDADRGADCVRSGGASQQVATYVGSSRPRLSSSSAARKGFCFPQHST